MALLGMDPTAVRALGTQLDGSAARIDALITALSAQLLQTPWVGHDRSAFETEWQGTHVAQLRAVAADLTAGGSSASRHAAAQELTSSH